MPDPLRIGVASCFFHADPTRPIFKGKTLLYHLFLEAATERRRRRAVEGRSLVC